MYHAIGMARVFISTSESPWLYMDSPLRSLACNFGNTLDSLNSEDSDLLTMVISDESIDGYDAVYALQGDRYDLENGADDNVVASYWPPEKCDLYKFFDCLPDRFYLRLEVSSTG
jgi:hypothetical protein